MLLIYMPYNSPRMSLGGWWAWGLHWVNPTAVREPLLLSPLLITWSLFLLSWMCVSGMCIWAHASWNLAFEISRTWFLYLKPFCLTLPGPLSCVAPHGLINISPLLPYTTLSISASNQGEVYTAILQRKKLKWCKCTCGIYTQRYLGFLPRLL